MRVTVIYKLFEPKMVRYELSVAESSPGANSLCILPLAIEVCTMPLQKIPPSDNIIFFAEMDGHLHLRGATFGFFRSFDLRLKSGL